MMLAVVGERRGASASRSVYMLVREVGRSRAELTSSQAAVVMPGQTGDCAGRREVEMVFVAVVDGEGASLFLAPEHWAGRGEGTAGDVGGDDDADDDAAAVAVAGRSCRWRAKNGEFM